jgi:hypothetical protein
MPRRVLLLPVLFVLAAGCSISESISKSVSSPLEWSSESSASSSRSSSPERGAAYRDDVRDFTAAYVQSGGQFDQFQRGLGNVAAKHGVSNWESDDTTYVGVGEGLKKAGVSSTGLTVWKSNLAGSDSSKAAAIQKGYDSYQPNAKR